MIAERRGCAGADHSRTRAHQLDGVPRGRAQAGRHRARAARHARAARRHRQRRRHHRAGGHRPRHRVADQRADCAGDPLRHHRLDGRLSRRLHHPRGGLPPLRQGGAPRPREESLQEHHPDQRPRRAADRGPQRARRRSRAREPASARSSSTGGAIAPTSPSRCLARTAAMPARTRMHSCSPSIRRSSTRSATPVRT